MLLFPIQQCNCYVQGMLHRSYIVEWKIITLILRYFVFAVWIHASKTYHY